MNISQWHKDSTYKGRVTTTRGFSFLLLQTWSLYQNEEQRVGEKG